MLLGVGMCRNPRSDYNWTVRDPNQVGEEYRTLEEKLKTLTRGLNKRVSTPLHSLLKEYFGQTCMKAGKGCRQLTLSHPV